jgi:hypothetical protein
MIDPLDLAYRFRWLILAGLAALAVLVAVLAIRKDAADDALAGRARADAAAEKRAGAGRETAATERHLDQAAADARLEERNRETDRLPDRAPDPRAHPRRCRQLRDAGHDVGAFPECRGSEG